MTVFGATEEEVGFDRRVTAAGVGGLTRLATSLAPWLAEATFVDAWAGLRPMTPDRLPISDVVPEIAGLFVATGHARNGIALAPATALVVAALLANDPPPVDRTPFSLQRFRGDAA